MKQSFVYGDRKIEYTIGYRNRKTLLIEVEAPDTVTVVAPMGTPDDTILETVQNKSKWIINKLYDLREMQYLKRDREFVNGESLLYLGRRYSLQLLVDPSVKVPEVKLIRGQLQVSTPSKEASLIRQALVNWYKDKAKERINERVAYYQDYFDVKPWRIRVKDQQKRWGSCTAKKELLFNWRCVLAPSHILDYIVVHEMCHLVYMNHSKEFWTLLKRVMPDYEERKKWLKNHGVKLEL